MSLQKFHGKCFQEDSRLLVHEVLIGALIQNFNQNISSKQKKFPSGSALNCLEKQTLPKAHNKIFRKRYYRITEPQIHLVGRDL